jgi:predicted ATPase
LKTESKSSSPIGLAVETPLVGRADDIGAVREMIVRGSARIVTLTGPAGVGKTRLAMAIATSLADAMADGMVFVPLSAVRNADFAPPAIARAFGVTEIPGEPLATTLVRYLGDKQAFLLLDSFEQVSAAAPFVAALRDAPYLSVLVTSRLALGIAEECVYPVPPLALPDVGQLPPLDRIAEYTAVQLFVERARAVDPAFMLTDENAPAVAAVCRALGGLPLALELAAAHSHTLALPAILDGLRAHLRDECAHTAGESVQEQSLRAAIAWSNDLLTARQQQLLARISVFVDGCTLDAAYIACGDEGGFADVLETLDTLHDYGVLRRTEGQDGEPRFAMPRSVRAFAAERLAASGDEAEVRRRYATYYLALAGQTEQMLRGPDQVRWLDRLEGELANIRAALCWAFDRGDATLGLRLASGLDRFWQYRAHLTEGRQWLARGLANGEVGEVPAAVRAKALSLAGWLERFQPGMGAAASLLAEGLALYEALDDHRGIAAVVDTLGDIAHFAGDQAKARALHEGNLAQREEIGDRWGMAMSLNSLGWIALEDGDHRRAARLLHQSLALVRQLGDRRGIAMVLTGLGWAALDGDDARQAAVDMRESLVLFADLGSTIDICLCLDGLAAVASLDGTAERAARLFGAAHALREAINVDYAAITERHYTRHREAIRARTDAARWAAAWAVGRALSMEQAIEDALHGNLAAAGEQT